MAPRRKPLPRNYSHYVEDVIHWSKLKRVSIYPDNHNSANRDEILHKRKETRQKQRDAFRRKFRLKRRTGPSSSINETVIKCLRHWVRFESWSFCKTCLLLTKSVLTPRCFNSKGSKFTTQCICKQGKYPIPSLPQIPEELKILSKSEEDILRVYAFDTGKYQKQRHGSRVKTSAFSLEYRPDTVEERIGKVEDEQNHLYGDTKRMWL